MRCLEKAPADRFRSMGALADALREPEIRAGGASRLRLLLPVGAALAVAAFAAVRLGVPQRISAARESAGKVARELVDDARAAVLPEPRREGAAGNGQRVPAAPARPPQPPAPASPARPLHAASSSTASRPALAASSRPRGGAAASTRRAAVELDLRSTPAGATVLRLDTGERLGKTPLKVNVAQKPAKVWLQMRLDGYTTVKFAVDLRSDASANVALKRVASKTARR